MKVPHDYVKTFCMSTSVPLFEDVLYRDYFAFAQAPVGSEAESKISKWDSVPLSDRPPNVLLIGIDTNSRLNSRRQLHQSLKILRELGAIEMLGYTKG